MKQPNYSGLFKKIVSDDEPSVDEVVAKYILHNRKSFENKFCSLYKNAADNNDYKEMKKIRNTLQRASKIAGIKLTIIGSDDSGYRFGEPLGRERKKAKHLTKKMIDTANYIKEDRTHGEMLDMLVLLLEYLDVKEKDVVLISRRLKK